MKSVVMAFSVLLIACNNSVPHKETTSALYLQCELSNFGVESTWYPSISGKVNFATGENKFLVEHDDPKYKDRSYTLSGAEVQTLRMLLDPAILDTLEPQYNSDYTDQATSTLKINTTRSSYHFKDYGLRGSEHLEKVYEIIYKIEEPK